VINHTSQFDIFLSLYHITTVCNLNEGSYNISHALFQMSVSL